MKYHLLILLILSFASCDNREPCEINSTGTLIVQNDTKSTIIIEIDGDPEGEIFSGQSQTYTVRAGAVNYKAKETGLFPDTWENSVIVFACSSKQISLID